MINFKSNEVSEVTLLSLEEAKALPKDILACEEWWLRSPGCDDEFAASVINVGSVDEDGCFVYDDCVAVRPAFQIPNLKSSNLQIGDIIEVAGTEAIIIADDMALAKEPVGYSAFREDYEKAEGANDYEASDVKKWLDDWWQNIVNADTIKELEEQVRKLKEQVESMYTYEQVQYAINRAAEDGQRGYGPGDNRVEDYI